MNPALIPVILCIVFVASAFALVLWIRHASKELGGHKIKLTREQKAMKRMGAKI